MNVLFVGSTSGIFSANLAFKMNQLEEISVDAVFPSNRINENQNNLDKYAQIYSYKFSNSSKIPKTNGLLNILRLITRLLKIKKYDIIHLQSIDPSMLYLMPIIKLKSNKIVSTVWGSDLNLCQNKYFFRLILKYSDLITCATVDFKKQLELILKDSNKKVLILPFSEQIIDELDNLKGITKQQAKMNFGIAPEKIVIGCGTNLRKAQHHLEIIDEIAKIKDKFSKSILVLIQLTYGVSDDQYLNKIKKKLDLCEIDYLVLSKSLTDKEVATLRIATDLLVQVQDHDQLSSAMLETLYANNLVVTGSWLPYSVLDDEGAYYFKVDRLSDLRDILLDCVNNYDQLVKKTKNNPKIISKVTNHAIVAQKWLDTYKYLNNNNSI